MKRKFLFEDGRAVGSSEYIKIDEDLLNNPDKLDVEMQKMAQQKNNAVVYVFLDLQNYKQHESLLYNMVDFLSDTKKDNQQHKCYLLYENDNQLYSFEDLVVLQNINKKMEQGLHTELQVPISYLKDNVGNQDRIRWKSYSTWTFKEMVRANQMVNNVASEILQVNLSPYERYLAAYSWVTSFIYKSEQAGDDWRKSRELNYVLNGNEIVCVGFAQLLKSVCSRLDVPVSMVYEDKPAQRGHAKCLVKLQDEKYGINGVFIADPTFDSTMTDNQNRSLRSFQFHLVSPKVNYTGLNITRNTAGFPLFHNINKDSSQLPQRLEYNYIRQYEENYLQLAKDGMMPSYITEDVYETLKQQRLQTLPKDCSEKEEKEWLQPLLEQAKQHNQRCIIGLHEMANKSNFAPKPQVFQQALSTVYHTLNLEYYNPTLNANQVDSLVTCIMQENQQLQETGNGVPSSTFSQEQGMQK